MSLRLRQVALAAADLERAAADLTAVFDLGPPYADPGVGVFGLRNLVFALADTFLEVVSPVRDDAPAARFLARKGGDAGYMAIFQTSDLARERPRLDALGVRVVFETELDDIATVHLHPRDVGGAIVSLDEARPPQSWRWAGPSWTSRAQTAAVGAIRSLEVVTRDAAATAARWSRVLDVACTSIGAGSATADAADERDGVGDAAASSYVPPDVCELRLDGGSVRFGTCLRERDEGIAAVDVEARDPERVVQAAARRGLLNRAGSVVICGTTFRLTERRRRA